jgi:antitoxin ParD1/3/4
MSIVNILLPDQMTQYIDERISDGSYNTASEYLRELIREDQKRRSAERVEAMLVRGIESPISEWTKDDAGRMKSQVRERLAANDKKS